MFYTRAGPISVVESVLPPQLRGQIRTHAIPDSSDANKNPLKTVGTIALVVRLGQFMVKLDLVRKSLEAPLTLGSDYSDRFVEAIRPRLRQVELRDETVVPLARQTLKRATKRQVPLPAEKDTPPAT